MKGNERRRLSTGIEGLDEILSGGLIPGRSYMLTGDPGTGKTILGLQFLETGANHDESVLCINLEEGTADIEQNARAVDVDTEGIEFLDLSPGEDTFAQEQSYDIFEPAQVEFGSYADRIVELVTEHEPTRVFIDPITQLRHLSPDPYQFKKQVLSFMEFLHQYESTVLFTSQSTSEFTDDDLHFICDGSIRVTRSPHGRRISVPKFRGSETTSGTHAMRIHESGTTVFPALNPGEHQREYSEEQVSSGIPEIDELLHGGLERGSVTVISGPTGVGKTTSGTQFMKEAAGRGEHSVIYLFEEAKETFAQRSEAINIPVSDMLDRGTLSVTQVETLTVSPEEFARDVRTQVEEHDAKIVMLDGISGYRMTVRGEELAILQEMQALCRYLTNMGVTVVLVDEISQVTGEFQATDTGLSYIADNIIFLRHIELNGELRKVIGVLKKRLSDFEHSLREFEITKNGIKVGDPMTGIRGILQGAPVQTSPEVRDDV